MSEATVKKALLSPGAQEGILSVRESLLGKPDILPQESQMAQYPVDNLTVWNHKKEIADKASASDYFGAMSREDGFIARGIGHLIGHEMFSPDESWRPFEEKTWRGLSEGIPEDLLPEFRKSIHESTNAQHAEFLKNMVYEKMRDRDLLGTLGTSGNVARFGYNLISPESIALGAASGWVAKVAGTIQGGMTLARASEAARTASKIEDPVLRTAQMAKAAAAMEEAGKMASKPVALAAGVANAAAGGAAFEKMRQAVNFEDNGDKVLESTLFSVAFAAPFIGLGAHQMNRLTRSAGVEREVLGFMQKMHQGETLTESELGKIREYGYYVEHIKQEAAGTHHTGQNFTQGMGEVQKTHDSMSDFQAKAVQREAPLTEPDGVTIGSEHFVTTPATTVEPPKEPFAHLWDNQDKPLGVRDELTVTHNDSGDTISGEVAKVGDGLVMLKDTTGKMRKLGVQDYTLDQHVPHINSETPTGKPVVIGAAKEAKKHTASDNILKRLTEGVSRGTAKQVHTHEVLKTLHKRFEGTVYAPVIKAMLKHPELPTKAHLSVDSGMKGVKGVYLGDKDVMVSYVESLNHMSDSHAIAFIHENVHAHVNAALEGKLDHVLTASQKDAVRNLKELHRLVEDHVVSTTGISKKTRKVGEASFSHYAGEHYGLTDVREFVAEALSNREFQKVLEGIKVGKTTALSELWKGIKKILGIGKELDDSALRAVLTHAEQLIGSRGAEHNPVSMKYDGGEIGGPSASLNHVLPASQLVPTGPSVMGFATIGGKKVPIRWDISQTFDNNLNPHIRQLGFDMVKNAIGWEGLKSQGITITERKERIRRVVAGEAHFTMREALSEAIDKTQISLTKRITTGFVESFYREATLLSRGDTEALTRNPEISAQLTKASGAIRKFYDDMGKRAMDSGLRGAINLPTGQNYVNRVYLHDKIHAMARDNSPEDVHALFAAAFRNPNIKGDMQVAKEFVSAINDLQFKTGMGELMLHANDLESLQTALRDHGLSDTKIDSIVNVMFDVKTSESDAGVASNLKHRMDLDETASITTASGKKLRISDLLENDARLLIDKYTNSMGGYISCAEHGWTDPHVEFANKVKEADAWVSENSTGYDMNKYAADKQLATDMFSYMVGRPMSTQTGGTIDRFMGAMRAYSRSVFLGQLGVASAFELKNAMAMSAYHGAWTQMPSFVKMVSMMRKGIPVDDQLAKDMQHIAGFGNEFAMQYARQHTITDHSYGKGLTSFENFANKAANVVDTISGNASFTSATRNLAAKMTAQHLYDIAAGKKVLDAALEQRLIHQGIPKESLKEVLSHLNEHSIADSNGVLQHIDWEGWQQHNRGTYGDFSLALERFTRDGIQDHNIGETMPWMHTTTGKILGELRTFNLVGHAKQFLKNVHYHDRTSAMIFMTGFVGESLAYSVQSSINYAHDHDALAKRLTADNIAKAAVGRLSTLGMLSYVIDTPFKWATGKPLLSSTNNTDNRDMFMSPSLMLMKRMVNGVQTAAQGMSPLADTITTKQEVKDSLGVLPGINTYGARNIVDFVASHYPKNDPSQYQH